MPRLLGIEEASAVLRERLPSRAAPAPSTLRVWCKPSWRRRRPGHDAPLARKVGRVWVWSVEDLEAWIERRIAGSDTVGGPIS